MSNQRARGTSKRGSRTIVEAVRPDHGCDTDIRKRGHCEWGSKQDIDAEAVVEVSQVPCRLTGVVVVRRAAIVITVVVVHDLFDVFAEVFDERCSTCLAAHCMREVALRGSDGLPR